MEQYKIDEHIERERGIMAHEITPKDRLQNQIRLASDLFLIMHGDTKTENEIDRDFRNRIMLYWNEEGYSKLYRDFEELEEFKFHPRLQGNIFAITPEDMMYYKEHGKVLEE